MSGPGISDPVSGQPASKNIAARIERFVAATYGFAVFRRKPEKLSAEYWALAKCNGGWRVELAFATDPADWSAYARDLFGRLSEPVVYRDTETGRLRFAAYGNGHLTGLLFLAPEPVAVSRDWAVSQLAAGDPALSKRTRVLAGRPGAETADRGAIVCACFGIGAHEIGAAAARGCCTVAAVGEATRAGTNCGSCRPEIKRIIQERQAAAIPASDCHSKL